MKINIDKIDKHKSMLLIGVGATNKYQRDVVQPEYTSEAREVFGDCDLIDSYEMLVDGHDASNIFIMNIEVMTDYLEIATFISSSEFAYIIPIDVGISNFFYDPNNNGKKTFYLQYMIESMPEQNETMFLVTDTHASLYQDIDQFLESMNYREKNFRSSIKLQRSLPRIYFVGNNLQGIAYANVELGRMILNSEVNEYPFEAEKKLQAVFDIDRTDNVGSMSYFRNHADKSVSIENLLNMAEDGTPIKIFFFYRICLYIAKELDFTDYIGSKYISYKKQQIEAIVTQYLQSLVGYLLIDYVITDVYAKENAEHPGTVDIFLNYAIQPIWCAETFITRTLRV